MASNNEYEQQQFWNRSESWIDFKSYSLREKNKEKLVKFWWNCMFYGEGQIHINTDKDATIK